MCSIYLRLLYNDSTHTWGERMWGAKSEGEEGNYRCKSERKKNLSLFQEFGRNTAGPWWTLESSYKMMFDSDKLSCYSCSYSVLLQLREITCYQELGLIKVTLCVCHQPWHIKSFSFTYVSLNLLKLLVQMCLWRSNNDISLLYDRIKEQRIHSAEENRVHFH